VLLRHVTWTLFWLCIFISFSFLTSEDSEALRLGAGGGGEGGRVLSSGPGPHPPRTGERGPCLSFSSSRLQNAHQHLRRASPNLRWGAEVTSHKTCTFLRTNVTQLHKGPESAPFQKPRPPSGRVLPDLFGADLPKAMPYWFCTNRVHL